MLGNILLALKASPRHGIFEEETNLVIYKTYICFDDLKVMSTLFGLVCLLFIRPTYSKQFSFTSGKCAFTCVFQKWVIRWWTSVWACTCVRMYVWVRTKRERASTVVCFVCVLPVRSHSHIKQMTRVSDLCFTTVIMVFPFSLQHILSSMRGLWFCVLVRRNSP